MTLLSAEPAGEAALGLGSALLDLAVRSIDLLQGLAAGVLAVLIELALGVGHFLLGFLGLRGEVSILLGWYTWWLEKRERGGIGRKSKRISYPHDHPPERSSYIGRYSTYSIVELCASLGAPFLGVLLHLVALAWQLALELGRGAREIT